MRNETGESVRVGPGLQFHMELCLRCSTVREQGVRPSGIDGTLTGIGSSNMKMDGFLLLFTCSRCFL